jgi:hypothetical protein
LATETDIAGMGYIITFFNDIENLTNTYASYHTIILSIYEKYPELKKGVTSNFKIAEADRLNLIEILHNFRTWIIRVHTKAMALKIKIKELNDPELENIYQSIKEKSMLDVDKMEKYVFAVHKCFVNGALEDLLMKITDYYSKIVGK